MARDLSLPLDLTLFGTALRVGLVVGSTLFCINHGLAFLAGAMTQGRWTSVALSYVVPCIVSLHGQLTSAKKLLITAGHGADAEIQDSQPSKLTPIVFLRALGDRRFQPTALKVAMVIGTIYFAINHGSALLSGDMTLNRWGSAVLSYCVPFCVNTHGQLSSKLRMQAQQP